MTVPLDSPPPLPFAASSRSNSPGEVTEIVSGASSSKSPWPPGFRFHPTDAELVLYHLGRKICCRRVKFNIIREVDVYKCEPWELPGKSLLQTGDKQWYFFSPRDRKYPNGARSNRGTKCGYWKATGKDRCISHNSRPVGMKKTLVFYNGRAPKGQRTNWVMHEYSMAREELQRCNAVQDSFALYKVYQKSGAGPKNGEEYGAPFREEEWLDDDDETVNESLGVRCNDQHTVPDPFDSHDQFHIDDDLGRVLQQILGEPEANQQCLRTSLEELEVGGEYGGPSSREAISSEPSEPHPWEPVEPGETGLPVEPGDTVVQPSEVTEVPYDLDWVIPNDLDWVNVDCSGTDGDFMELNDLNDREPSGLSLQNINSSMVPQDMGGSCNQQLAASCLPDINSDMLSHAINKLHDQEPSTFSIQDVNNDLFSYNMDGLSDPNIYIDAPICFPEEIVPLDFSTTVVASQLDHQFLNHSTEENLFHQPYISSPLWAHEEKLNAFSTPSESSQVLVTSPNSGAVCDDISTNADGGTQVKGSIMGNASNRWFTSAVYSLLESIPTNPASATENALINRAFERMSSFGTGRSGSSDMNDNVGAASAGPGRRQGRNSGILFVSFLGALCAVLWVLMIGTTVKVFKSFAGKFIAS